MQFRILTGLLMVILVKGLQEEISFHNLNNIDSLDFKSILTTFEDFELSVNIFSRGIENILHEVINSGQHFLNQFEDDQNSFYGSNLSSNHPCNKFQLNKTKINEAFNLELMLMRLPIKEALSEINETLNEVKYGLQAKVRSEETRLALCRLSKVNCTNEVAGNVKEFIKDYVCRLNGYCTEKNMTQKVLKGSDIISNNTELHRRRRSIIDKCGLDQFTCRNGNCINRNYVCDNDNDCRDFSDEKYGGCSKGCTDKSYIRCLNLNCIEISKVCNRVDDCGDNSDEEGCNLPCSENQFKCKNERCINAKLVCNKINDCGDNSDEISGCPEECVGKRCRNLNCIKPEQFCNKINDCGDNSDEEGCGYPEYNETNCGIDRDTFICSNGTQCIELKYVCDGKLDCIDKTDESEECKKPACSVDKCIERGAVCLKYPTGDICLRNCPYGFQSLDGFCKLTPTPVISNSLLSSIQRTELGVSRLLASFRLLKLQTRHQLSNITHHLINCINNVSISKKIIL